MTPAGPWRDGVRKSANGSWDAKHGNAWSRGHATKKDAQEARGRLIAASKRRRSNQETVKAFSERWLEDFPRPAASTNSYNQERVSAFVKTYGKKRLSEVTRGDAERFARKHPGRITAVKAMFSDAVHDQADGITTNPFQHVKKPKSEGRKQITPLTREEVDKLAQIAEQTLGDYGRDVYAPLIITAAWTGLRPGELYALEWRDLDGELLHVRRQWRDRSRELVEHTKNYERRTIPLAQQVLEALERVPRIEGQPFIFFTPTVTKDKSEGRLAGWSSGYYWRQVRREFVKQLPKDHWLRERKTPLAFYELRHYTASWLMEQDGVRLYDVARFLGHRDEGELAKLVYVHRREEDARERVRRALWAA
jgi:integrase